MNKKGKVSTSLGAGLAWAFIIGIIILVMLFTGGAKTLANIASFMSRVPAVVWVVLGIILLFKMVSGKR